MAGHVGRAVTGDQVVDVNSSEVWVRLDRDADYGDARTEVKKVVDGYPGLSHRVVTYEKQRIKEVSTLDDRQGANAAADSADLDVLTGADRRPLTVRVYGEDLRRPAAAGGAHADLMAGVDGVKDPRVEPLAEEPAVTIRVDLQKAQRYGIKPGDVRRAEATLLSGIQVGSLFQNQKVFDVVVRGTPELGRSLTDIRRLLIDTPRGGHVRLGSVADVLITPTLQTIKRESSSRRIDITADVSGRGIGAVKDDVEGRLRDVRFPLEYHAAVIGHPTGQVASLGTFILFGLAAAAGIFLLLQAAFGSWRLASLMFVTLPLALVGGEIAALIAGGTVSSARLPASWPCSRSRRAMDLARLPLSAARAARGPDPRPRAGDARCAGTAPADLMTSSATALALLPLIVLGTRPGYEVVHPMAIVVVGGLVTSTLLTLFLVPAVYLRFGGGAPSAMAPELELLHRWAGHEPTAEDVTESTKEVAVEEHGRAPAASGAQVEEGSSETDKAQQ